MNEDRLSPCGAVERNHILEPDCADWDPPERVGCAIGEPDPPSAIRQQSRITVIRARRRLRRGAGLALFVEFGVRLNATMRITLSRGRIYRPCGPPGQHLIESGRCERPV